LSGAVLDMHLIAILAASLLAAWPPGRTVSVASPQQGQQTASPQQSSPAPPPDQEQVPAAAPESPPAAPPASASESSQSAATPEISPAPAAKTPKHRRTHKATVAATPGSEPTKTVVRKGGVPDPSLDLSSGSPEQNSRQLETTRQLLVKADTNLKKVSGKQLSPGQQDTLKQIKSYMQDEKEAEAAGDVHRAYNLAVKVNLLSAELAGH
jgi:hypothetical protein